MTARIRPARTARLLAVLSTVVTVAVTGSAVPAQATPNGTVKTWVDDHLRSVVDTEEEAVAVARRHNVVLARDNYKPFLGAMRAANPRVVVAPYRNAISVISRTAERFAAEHPTWLLRDASGALLQDTVYKTFLLDPANPEVHQWHAEAARAAEAAGWSGIYLDCLGTYGLTAFGGHPVDPRTGVAYTKEDWLAATAALSATVRDAVTIPVIGNGLRDGTSYDSTQVLSSAAEYGLFEACFRPATAAVTWWPSLAAWNAQVTALRDVVARGSRPLCMVKTWSGGTSAEKTLWRDFATASYLVAAGESGGGLHFTAAEDHTVLQHNGLGHVALGSPVAKAVTTTDGAVKRQFTGGMVVVNPTANSQRVSLGGSYRTASGSVVTSVSLASRRAMFLTKA